eukprot:2702812-Rhodomonas_salina.1
MPHAGWLKALARLCGVAALLPPPFSGTGKRAASSCAPPFEDLFCGLPLPPERGLSTGAGPKLLKLEKVSPAHAPQKLPISKQRPPADAHLP